MSASPRPHTAVRTPMTERPARRRRSWVLVPSLLAAAVPLGCSGLGKPEHTTPPVVAPQAAPRGMLPAFVGAVLPPAKRPAAYTSRLGPYAFHTEFPLDVAEPLYRELEDLPEQIERELQLTCGQSLIQIFLFDDEEKYHAFLRAKDPKLPLRSAYFFAEPARGYANAPDLHVYTWFSPRLKTDLRHELTHALLHGSLKSVPIWLDEGLAGFFEQSPANDGVNIMHLDSLRTSDSPRVADLARLEKLREVSQMGRVEYQESWAWVHYLLRGEAAARKVFLEHLKALRGNPSVGPLLSKLETEVGDPNAAMLRHLSRLELPARAKATGPITATIPR